MSVSTSLMNSVVQRYNGLLFHFKQNYEPKGVFFDNSYPIYTVEAGLYGLVFSMHHSQTQEIYKRDFCSDDEGRILHAKKEYFDVNFKYFERTPVAFHYIRRIMNTSPVEQLRRERGMKIYESNPDGSVRSCDWCAGSLPPQKNHWGAL